MLTSDVEERRFVQVDREPRRADVRGRELAEPSFATGHVRTQCSYEPIGLLDQSAKLGFGHRLIREDFAQPFEKSEIRCLGQDLSLPDVTRARRRLESVAHG